MGPLPYLASAALLLASLYLKKWPFFSYAQLSSNGFVLGGRLAKYIRCLPLWPTLDNGRSNIERIEVRMKNECEASTLLSRGGMSLEFWPQMLNLICCFKVINYLRRYNFWRDYFKKQKHSVGRVEEQGIFSSLKVFKIRPNGWIKPIRARLFFCHILWFFKFCRTTGAVSFNW